MKKCSFLLGFLAAVATALCQGSTASYLNTKEEGAFLLTFVQVQKELSATPEQVKKWNAMFQKLAADEQAIYDKSKPDAGPDQLAATAKAVESQERLVAEQALALATDAQIKRLKQISLWQMELEAFGKDDVQSQLGFSADQKKKVNKLVKSYQDKQDDVSAQLARQEAKVPQPSLSEGAAGDKYREKVDKEISDFWNAKTLELKKLRTDLLGRVVATMTNDQRGKWEAMLGAPFHMSN